MGYREKYEQLSQSPVFLEEEQHVYIHKENRTRFLSVTGALSLVKNDFPVDIKSGIVKQYVGFLRWFNSKRTDIDLIELIGLYTAYKGYRPFKMSKKGWKQYKSPSQYDTVEEMYEELQEIKFEVDLTADVRPKHIYLRHDMAPMSEDQIGQLWVDLTYAANLYGSMVHEIVEHYLLLKQMLIDGVNLEQRIEEGYNKLKDFLGTMNYVSNPSFDQYNIEMPLEDFKAHVLEKFKALNCELGEICVPEMVMYSPEHELCGMSDIVAVWKDYFDIGDHKTNKELNMSSKYGNKLLKPFHHMDECSFNIYSLQTNIYGEMYEKATGKKLRNMWISYYDKRYARFKKYEIKDMRSEARYVMNLHKVTTQKRTNLYRNSPSNILEGVPEHYHMHLSYLLSKRLANETALKVKYASTGEKEAAYRKYIAEYLKIQNEIEIATLAQP